MAHEQFPKPNRGRLKFLAGVFLFALQGFLSCNHDSKNKATTDSNTVVNDSDSTLAPPPNGGYAVLQLDSAVLVELLTDANTQKLLLQFSITSGNNQPHKLIAYGARPNNNIISGPRALNVVASMPSWDTTGDKIMGNLELSRGELRSILGLGASSGKIPDDRCKTLYFFPTKISNDHIVYRVSRSLTTTTGVAARAESGPSDSFTNPSPPDPPCSIDCDN